MVQLHEGGKSTGYLSSPLVRKELNKLSIEQLLIIAKRKKGFKESLLNFLEGIKI